LIVETLGGIDLDGPRRIAVGFFLIALLLEQLGPSVGHIAPCGQPLCDPLAGDLRRATAADEPQLCRVPGNQRNHF
jgi:hypothetical protein